MESTHTAPSTATFKNLTLIYNDSEVYGLLKQAAEALAKYVWIIPVTLGIPGNILSIIVATRQRNRKLSPCVYIVAMAVIDSAQLVHVAWFYPFFLSDVGREVLRPRVTILKSYLYMMYTFGMQSGFYQSAMSVDRLIAVRFPLAANRLCTTSRARKTVIVLFIVVAAININVFYTMKYMVDPESGIEFLVVSVPGGKNLALFVSGFSFALGTLIPFVVISVCNIFIILGVRDASVQRYKMAVSNHVQNEPRKEDTQFLTRMMILVSTAYILTSMPYRCYLFIIDFPGVSYDLTQTYWNLRRGLEVALLFDLWCCNYAVNFYLYCLGGGKRYRQDIREVFEVLTRRFFPKREGSAQH